MNEQGSFFIVVESEGFLIPIIDGAGNLEVYQTRGEALKAADKSVVCQGAGFKIIDYDAQAD